MTQTEKIIPMEQCEDRGIYWILSRNLIIGVYSKEHGGFIGIREKFGSLYLFMEYHRDNGPPYGTVAPLEKLGELPKDIPNEENESHKHGDSWLNEGRKFRAVIRRDLKKGEEEPHGKRQGFVDEYVDTGERLPDNIYPFLRENKKLFDYLKKLEEKKEGEK